MATIEEVRKALDLEKWDLLTYAKILALNGQNITEGIDKERLLAEFVKHPENERLLCLLCGLKTEEEKMTEAARSSAHAAWLSTAIAFLALCVSIFALYVSITQ